MSEYSHRLKLDRAFKHASALSAAVQTWAEREPCEFVGDCDVESREHALRIRVMEQPADPAIPLLLGDCIHNMRCALDHLAYRLACVVHKADPPPNAETTMFPIRGSHDKFVGGLGNHIGPKKKMPTGLYAALEGLQPYHGGDGELLSVLHRLDNIDKHRFPPVVAAVANVPRVDIGQLVVNSITGPQVGPVEDGAAILTFQPVPDYAMRVNVEITPSIAFDKRSTVAARQLVIPLLNGIGHAIETVVLPTFEPFL